MTGQAEGQGGKSLINKTTLTVAWTMALEGTTHIGEKIIAPAIVALWELVRTKVGLTIAWTAWAVTLADFVIWGGAVGLTYYFGKKALKILKWWYDKLPGGGGSGH